MNETNTDAKKETIAEKEKFPTSYYWETRYAAGGHSGSGTQGKKYAFKREYINQLIERYSVRKALDLGCGDGKQASQLKILDYHGMDVSPSVIERCRELYKSRDNYRFDVIGTVPFETYDIALSIDVIYHVVNEDDYWKYLQLFLGLSRFSLLYGNFLPENSDVDHMHYRNNVESIETINSKATLLETAWMVGETNFGFALWDNLGLIPDIRTKSKKVWPSDQ